MGLWLLSESVRAWQRRGARRPRRAARGRPPQVTAPCRRLRRGRPALPPPGRHAVPDRVHCREHGLAAPPGSGRRWCGASWTACAGFRRRSIGAERLSGRDVDVVHLVGGGAQNELLCQPRRRCGRRCSPDRSRRPRWATCSSRRGAGSAPRRPRGAARRCSAGPSDLGDADRATRLRERDGAMKVALFVTCLNDTMFPATGQGGRHAAAPARRARSTSRARRPAAARCTSTPATSPRRSRPCGHSSTPSRAMTPW